MRIISWNCNMAFRKKFHKIITLQPDILMLQECEHENILREALQDIPFKEIFWIGHNKHKGVCLIQFGDFTIKKAENYNPAFNYIVPFTILTPSKINLFVIWAMPHTTDRSKSYVGQIWGAVHYYKTVLDSPSILLGDFNSNTIWDRKKRIGNHTHLVDFLRKKQIESLYHKSRNQAHGAEKEATFYMYKKVEKPYHLDYCFLSRTLITPTTQLKIGDFSEWIGLSDHMPLIVDI